MLSEYYKLIVEIKNDNLDFLQKKFNLDVLVNIKNKGDEQKIVLKEIKDLLKDYNLAESFLNYLNWIAGEIVNNVFDHAQTLGLDLSGAIFLVKINKKIKKMELGFLDFGIGIKNSLNKNAKIQKMKISDKEALKLALSENVSGWPYKRGNGLPDVWRIIKANQGNLTLQSGEAFCLNSQIKKTKKIFEGTFILTELNLKNFQVQSKNSPLGKEIKLNQFGEYLSGREKGQEAYEILIKKLIELPKDGVLLINLTEVKMMNSSFGDQAFGVLLENIKDGHFGNKKVYFTGEINEVVNFCLERIKEIRKVEIVKY